MNNWEKYKKVKSPKQKLLEKLKKLTESQDTEVAHAEADELLIKYIDDPDIKAAYEKIEKWYA